MTEKMGKWPSGHRKTEKSGHRLTAEKTLFPRWWHGAMISANLQVIWEMSVKMASRIHYILRSSPYTEGISYVKCTRAL